MGITVDMFTIAGKTFTSRLFVGTGKYATYELMQQALDASGCQVVTVCRRESAVSTGRSILTRSRRRCLAARARAP